MTQPHIPEQGIVPLLIQEQLASVPQPLIRLTILIRVRCWTPGAALAVQVEDVAFADGDEEADGVVASAVVSYARKMERDGKGEGRGETNLLMCCCAPPI